MSAQENPPNEGEPIEEKPIQRSSERKRATRTRKKIAAGTATTEEVDWLKNYDATKQRVGRPTTVVAEPDDDEPDVVEPDVEPVPPPPPPPRIHTSSGLRDAEDNGNQRRNAKATDDARQKAVVLFASQWKSGLDFLNDQIRMSGGTPFLETKHLWPFMVETVDNLLPDKVVMKPALVASVGTTVILVQRVARHRKIAEAYERGVPAPEPPRPAPPSPTPPTAESSTATESKPEPTVEVPAPVEPIIKLAHDTAVEVNPPGGVW